jgi:acetoin utilization deacetylase AcuC-like enzyme
MAVLLYRHDVFVKHDTGPWHPERPDRMASVLRGARESGVELIEREPDPAPLEVIERVHDPAYVGTLQRFCAAGGGALDVDTVVSEDSWEAALRAAGAGLEATAALRRGEGDFAFLAVRPPGHHALRSRAMGFCMFNNVAVTAADLAARGERVVILDWDVHHGNGTQDSFYESGEVVFLSMHQFPFYPGTGWVDEDGDQEGSGHVVNLPFPAGTGGDVYGEAMERVVVPVIARFEPDWLLVSCGFDAHIDDPLANQMLLTPDYGRMAQAVASVAPRRRLVFFLEGGYDLDVLRAGTAETLRGAAGIPFGDDAPLVSQPRSRQILDLVAGKVSRDWELG